MIVLKDDHALVLAGDTSYSQLLMLDEAVDGVAPDEQVSLQALRRIHAYTQQVPTVYLPSHDPQARERLFHRQTVLFPEISKAALSCFARVTRVIGVGREIGWMKDIELLLKVRADRAQPMNLSS